MDSDTDRSGKRNREKDEVCGVCDGEYDDDDDDLETFDCGCVYHEGCRDKQSMKEGHCPVCRSDPEDIYRNLTDKLRKEVKALKSKNVKLRSNLAAKEKQIQELLKKQKSFAKQEE